MKKQQQQKRDITNIPLINEGFISDVDIDMAIVSMLSFLNMAYGHYMCTNLTEEKILYVAEKLDEIGRFLDGKPLPLPPVDIKAKFIKTIQDIENEGKPINLADRRKKD